MYLALVILFYIMHAGVCLFLCMQEFMGSC